MTLDEVDRPAKLDAAVKLDGIGHRPRVGLAALEAMRQPEGQFEMPRHVTGVVLARSAQPFAQIGADRGDAVLPDAIDGRGKVVLVPGSDLRYDLLKELPRPIEIAWPHRQQVLVAQAREQFELDIVDERAALQRVELVDHGGHLARREAVHGLQEEAVRAAGKVLKRGRRIAAGSERVPAHDRPNRVRSTEETIGGRPVAAPALVPAPQRPGEIRIDGQEIAGPAGALIRKGP